MAIKIETCKDAIFEVDRFDVVLVSATIYCMLHGGFGAKIRNRYPIVQEIDDVQPYADQRRLGTRVTIPIKGGPTVSLLYCCRYPNRNRVYLDYEALEHALLTAAAEFKGRSIMCPWLGSSQWDGNGDKDKCMEIMEKCLGHLDVTVFDYQQYSYWQELRRIRNYMFDMKRKDRKRFDQLGLTEDKLLKQLYMRPADHTFQPRYT